jgi:1-acyl-sn-glycerol-3-phosphate acyltransferase
MGRPAPQREWLHQPPLPSLGPETPRRGNPLSRAVGRAALRLIGWKVEGVVPNVPRLVAVVAPHTSAWDVIVGLAMILALGLRVNWLGKHTVFWPPLGTVLRGLGGIPVNRRVPGGIVAQVIEWIERSDGVVLALAPEGTRQRRDRWKTGFHRIARGVQAPVVPVRIDYRRKVVEILPPETLTGDVAADLQRLDRHFEPAMARHPERFSRSTWHRTRRRPPPHRGP